MVGVGWLFRGEEHVSLPAYNWGKCKAEASANKKPVHHDHLMANAWASIVRKCNLKPQKMLEFLDKTDKAEFSISSWTSPLVDTAAHSIMYLGE